MTNALRWRGLRAVVAFFLMATAVVGTSQVASAHTKFDSSAPSDGDVVDGPLSEVVVNFTNPAQPAGEGFELLDPDGAVRTPTSIDETDGTSFVLSFDPPLTSGTYGVRWKVRAGDAHPIDGTFQFEVTGTAPTTTAAETAPTTPATTAAETDTTIAAAAASPPTTTPTSVVAASSEALDDFLNASSADGAAVGRIGRTLSMLGLIFGVGVLAALIWTIRGTRDDLAALLTWTRLAGLVILTGGLVEYAALAEIDSSSSLGTLMSTRPGFATLLKILGGLVVMIGLNQSSGRFVSAAGATSGQQRPRTAHSLSAAVATDVFSADAGSRESSADAYRWVPTTAAALGGLGYGLVLISFSFDGHTMSRGAWPIHALMNIIHLVAAGAWAGGVFAMTAIAWKRRRRSERTGLAAMVTRFSSTASVSLAAVTVAGLIMTWLITDGLGDVFNTDWGRILIVKTLVVAFAAAIGAFNHFRLRPALERRPDDPDLARELRITLSVESVAFVVVVVLTAVLVASAV